MKKQLKIILAFLIMAVIVTANIVIAATGKVNDNNIRMRKEANTKSEIITNLYKDDKVEILEKDGIWYKIKYEGKVGYMRADLIDVTLGTVPNATTPEASTTQVQTQENTQQETTNPVQTPETTVTKKEYIVKLDTKIKTYPVIYSRDKEEIKKGEKIEKVEELGKWVKIKKNTTIGWVLSTELE